MNTYHPHKLGRVLLRHVTYEKKDQNDAKHMSTKDTNFLFECVQELSPDIHSQEIKCLRL